MTIKKRSSNRRLRAFQLRFPTARVDASGVPTFLNYGVGDAVALGEIDAVGNGVSEVPGLSPGAGERPR